MRTTAFTIAWQCLHLTERRSGQFGAARCSRMELLTTIQDYHRQSMSVSLAGIQGPATGILQTASDHDAAWEFVKWWISADTQLQFGRELENLMGTAARYPTANLEAFLQLPWTSEQREKLLEQWHWVEGSLEVPGGYYMNRMFDWAFRAVVVDDDFTSARETLTKYNMDINYELRLKRDEFGLELTLDEIPQEYIDLFWSRFTHIQPRDQY